MHELPFSARLRVLLPGFAVVGLLACSPSVDEQPSSDTSTTKMSTSAADSTLRVDTMRGLRYCEVLLLNLTEAGLQAEVYNSYPLNDCPDDVWRGLDGAAIAESEGVPFALLNGPRYWLMDSVERLDDGSVIERTFSGSAGKIGMNRYAVVTLGTPDTIGQAYVPQSVDRRSRFTFQAGSTIFVLTDANGARYVMQSWSQQRDPELDETNLADLGSRLDLPDGWTFDVETLATDLVIDSTGSPAQVFQDELMNTYSLVTS